MKHSVGVLASAAWSLAVLSLTACGDGGDEAGPGTVTTVADAAAAADTTEMIAPPPATAPPATAPPATSPATEPPVTEPPPTVPAGAACLDGSWWLSPDQTTSLYAALLPGIPVTVTGTHWVEFAGGAVDWWVVLEARFAVGGVDVTFGIDQHSVGSYAVVDDVLVMTYDTVESTIHEGHGMAITDPTRHPDTYADDAVALALNGDGTITIDRVTIPVIEIPPVGGGPMGCDDDTMSLGFTSGLADTAAVYVRMS